MTEPTDPNQQPQPQQSQGQTPNVVPQQPPSQQQTQPEPPAKGDADWQQHAKTWEQRAKANQDQLEQARAKLKEIEDAKLDELQRTQRDLAERDERLAALQRQADQSAVALEKGLPAALAATLAGATRDEMLAHADQLLTWRESGTPRGPQPNPLSGPQQVTPQQAEDAEYAAFFPQHQK